MGQGVRGVADVAGAGAGGAAGAVLGTGVGGPPYLFTISSSVARIFTATGWSAATGRSSSRSGSDGSANGRYTVSTISKLE